jgi:localization factor PodJL
MPLPADSANASLNGSHDYVTGDLKNNGPRMGDTLRTMKGHVETISDRTAPRRPSPAYEEPWDIDSANDLMRIYEVGGFGEPAAPTATITQHALPEPLDHVTIENRHSVAERVAPSPSPTIAAPAHAALAAEPTHVRGPSVLDHHEIAKLAHDPEWLDARFVELTATVERSIAEANPARAIADLGQRFAEFELRVTDLLSDLTVKPDETMFAPFEQRLQGFSSELQSATKHFERLDAIEAHLADLSQIAAAANAEPLALEPRDELHPPTLSNVQALLEAYTADRQRIDLETASTLETIQEALVRLIDRIEQVDGEPSSHTDQSNHADMVDHAVTSEPMPTVATPAVSLRSTAPTHPAPAQALADDESGPGEMPVEPLVRAETFGRAKAKKVVDTLVHSEVPTAPAQTSSPSPVESATPTIADVLASPTTARKDFEASALRARMRAATAQSGEPSLEIPKLAPDASEPPKSRDRLSQRPVTSSVSTGVSRRALVIAMIGSVAIGLGYLGFDMLMSQPSEQRLLDPKPAARVASPTTRPAAAPVVSPAVSATAVSATADAKSQPTTSQRSAPTADPVSTRDAAPRESGARDPGARELGARDAGMAPAFTEQPKNATAKPVLRDPVRASGDAAQPAPPPRLAPPRSIPETATDDLSLNSAPVERIPQRTVQNMNANATGSTVPALAPMGMVIDTSRAPPKPDDILRMQQRRELAMATNTTASASGISASAATSVSPLTTQSNRATTESNQPVPARIDRVSATQTDADTTPESNRIVAMPPAAIGPQTLRTAAMKGDASAEFEVAVRFAEGKGIKQNFDEALVWYQRSATHGFAPAQYRLGTLYERGLGAQVDLPRAKIWYQRAAEQGNVKAMHNLAVLSAGQRASVADYETAAVWFNAAAERGLSDSQFNLAVLYENGLGVAKDTREAYKWFALAAKSGDKESIRRRDVLGGKLSAEDFKLAEGDAETFRAKRVEPSVNDARVAGDQWRGRYEATLQ